MKWMPSRAEAADELRGARTPSGSQALRPVAQQFDMDAARVDPSFAPLTSDDVKDGDAASLVRLRAALERQSAQWLQRGRATLSLRAAE
jgi:hypothetical protein